MTYFRTLYFMHKVYYNVSCVVISDIFICYYNVHQVNTRSNQANFYLYHAVASVQKSFIVFSGFFCGMAFLLTLINIIHDNCLKLRLLMILFIGTFNSILYYYQFNSCLLLYL